MPSTKYRVSLDPLTIKLLIELLNQEIKRSDRLPTLFYKNEVEEAKQDLIRFINRDYYTEV